MLAPYLQLFSVEIFSFLEVNGKKEGVVTLPSDLQYKVITKGTGRSPKPDDGVTVHYRGTFIDGTEFDSSYRRGKPVQIHVNGVIPGWAEALQLMQEAPNGNYLLLPRWPMASRVWVHA